VRGIEREQFSQKRRAANRQAALAFFQAGQMAVQNGENLFKDNPPEITIYPKSQAFGFNN
jgi:Tfp pilus assembly protein PilX